MVVLNFHSGCSGAPACLGPTGFQQIINPAFTLLAVPAAGAFLHLPAFSGGNTGFQGISYILACWCQDSARLSHQGENLVCGAQIPAKIHLPSPKLVEFKHSQVRLAHRLI